MERENGSSSELQTTEMKYGAPKAEMFAVSLSWIQGLFGECSLQVKTVPLPG